MRSGCIAICVGLAGPFRFYQIYAGFTLHPRRSYANPTMDKHHDDCTVDEMCGHITNRVNALLDPVKSVTTAPVLADDQSMGNILQTAMEKNKMRKHMAFFVCFMIVIVSCAVKAETSPTSMSTTTMGSDHPTSWVSEVTSTAKPLLTSSPIQLTPTLTSSTPTLTPSITLSPTPVSNIIENCLEIQQNLPVGHTYTGTVAFENGFGFRNGVPIKDNISLYNIQTEKITFTDTGLFSSASPNHTLFAYHNLAEDRLKIFDANGNLLKSTGWGKNWRFVERWLDDQNILLPMAEPGALPEDLKYPPNVLLLNPFTGQSQVLLADYPDIDSDTTRPIWLWPRSSVTMYSPDLKRVVYPGGVYVGSPDAARGYVLYGIPEKSKLAQISNSYWLDSPFWSPDGSKFIMLGNHEFYLVSYDGIISQITHLNPDFDLGQGIGLRYIVDYLSWSPDNQHVAFWLSMIDTKRYTLAVLDTLSGKVTDNCILAGEDGLPQLGYTTLYPIWSPDGKKLVVPANFSSTKDSNDVILVDLEKKVAYKIANNNFPFGWLISP